MLTKEKNKHLKLMRFVLSYVWKDWNDSVLLKWFLSNMYLNYLAPVFLHAETPWGEQSGMIADKKLMYEFLIAKSQRWQMNSGTLESSILGFLTWQTVFFITMKEHCEVSAALSGGRARTEVRRTLFCDLASHFPLGISVSLIFWNKVELAVL